MFEFDKNQILSLYRVRFSNVKVSYTLEKLHLIIAPLFLYWYNEKKYNIDFDFKDNKINELLQRNIRF